MTPTVVSWICWAAMFAAIALMIAAAFRLARLGPCDPAPRSASYALVSAFVIAVGAALGTVYI